MLKPNRLRRYSTGVLSCLTLLLILASLVHAQVGLTGKWQGTTRNGMKVVLDLKATDTTLTGTVTRDGQASAITDGKVSKNTITFKAVLGEETESLTGELGDGLRVWLDRQGPDGAVVFKRAEN